MIADTRYCFSEKWSFVNNTKYKIRKNNDIFCIITDNLPSRNFYPKTQVCFYTSKFYFALNLIKFYKLCL